YDPIKKQKYSRFKFLKDFLIGATVGLANQFIKQHEEHAMSAKITDMIVFNDKALDTFIHTKFPDIGAKAPTKKEKVRDAYNHGVEVGENISLGKALKSASTLEVESKLLA